MFTSQAGGVLETPHAIFFLAELYNACALEVGGWSVVNVREEAVHMMWAFRDYTTVTLVYVTPCERNQLVTFTWWQWDQIQSNPRPTNNTFPLWFPGWFLWNVWASVLQAWSDCWWTSNGLQLLNSPMNGRDKQTHYLVCWAAWQSLRAFGGTFKTHVSPLSRCPHWMDYKSTL